MPKIKYMDRSQLDYMKNNKWMWIIDTANAIINEYQAKGFDLTLRQLYYQFVARTLIPNKQSEYDRLGVILNSGRLAGLVDWNAIVDRTRNVKSNTHWRNPGQIIDACAYSFMVDRWKDQATRIEVWVEKDALTGVIGQVCKRIDVPYFSCRGYTSASEMWRGAQRIIGHVSKDQNAIIIHLGDHDPSGMDMTRDIIDRLSMFTNGSNFVEIKRMALNINQVEELDLPPNPAKLSDSRAKAYIADFGRNSWELDALDPEYIEKLIATTVAKFRDEEVWEKTMEKEREMVATLKALAAEHGED
jgi:hypothetical protein